ncbi:MAG: thioredoxin family protein [Prosthecobacter sp.]|uniref:protein-disulfide reductase DsbD family protein n=1 Tax=Prosthecobacter sp. TaxID=1965333 RepID=UPI0025ED27CF|nr:thioredoxin family protein [Prosthecobacter sp.]MCF7784884.1 thioredoxin family protein [Prosthecobacter sp.]
MNRSCFLSLAALLLAATVAPAQNFGLGEAAAPKQERVTAELIAAVSAAAPGQPFQAAVKLVHAKDCHTYGKVLPPGVIGKPTKLTWTLPEGWQIEELPWPATHQVPSTDGAISDGYDGTVYLPVKITPPASAAIGSSVELKVKVNALVCDPKSCLPFPKEVTLSLGVAATPAVNEANASAFSSAPATEKKSAETAAVTPAANESKSAATITPTSRPAQVTAPKSQLSFAQLLLYAFVGGLILNIMPCVFPVLGIKVTSVVQQAGEDRRKVVLHGLMYTVGVLLSFWVLGGVAIALNKGWGSQLQSPAFNFFLAAFFLIFALNMAGLFEIGTSAIGVGSGLQAKSGLGGSFFSGLLATVVATPCSAPFLGTALGATLALPASQSMLIFTLIGLGLASPFLLLSLFPGLISALPRPGAWMESFKQGMSFLLFGTVGFMLYVLTNQIEGLPVLFAILSLVLIALGCWIYGRWALPHKTARTQNIARLLTFFAVAGGLWLGLPNASAKRSHAEEDVNLNDPDALHWETWSPGKVAALRAAKQPVYIDFTASWCWTCQVNKRVYSDTGLRALFKQHHVATLKADWSDENETIRLALEALGKRAVPVNVLYIPGAEEPFILDELLTVGNVTAALKKLEK